jgi:hypothetical protein
MRFISTLAQTIGHNEPVPAAYNRNCGTAAREVPHLGYFRFKRKTLLLGISGAQERAPLPRKTKPLIRSVRSPTIGDAIACGTAVIGYAPNFAVKFVFAPAAGRCGTVNEVHLFFELVGQKAG